MELLPGRNQARGVGADLAHVGELDEVRVTGELRPQERDLAPVDGDQDGLVGSERGAG